MAHENNSIIYLIKQAVKDDADEAQSSGTLPSGLSPQHKAAVVLFLERVYGVQDQMTFFRLLEDGFLPDLRAATSLEAVSLIPCLKALAFAISLFLLSLSPSVHLPVYQPVHPFICLFHQLQSIIDSPPLVLFSFFVTNSVSTFELLLLYHTINEEDIQKFNYP